MHQTNPNKQDTIDNSNPKYKSQIRLRRKFPVLLDVITSRPNGQKVIDANLKHWTPIGIATIVQQQTRPATTHNKATTAPPNSIQSIFPNVRIRNHLHRVIAKNISEMYLETIR